MTLYVTGMAEGLKIGRGEDSNLAGIICPPWQGLLICQNLGGRGVLVPPASALPTSLCWQVTIDRISRDIFFCNARIRTQFICTHYVVHIPVIKDCSKAQIERTF